MTGGDEVQSSDSSAAGSSPEAQARLREADAVLRDSAERQAFLLRLSDALRSSIHSLEVQDLACRLLGEHLDADRVYYVEVDEEKDIAIVNRSYERGAVFSLIGRHPVSAYGWLLPCFRSGDPVVVHDAADSDMIPEPDRAALKNNQLTAFVDVPVVKRGRIYGVLCVTSVAPRNWTDNEVSLIREVAERLWDSIERARAEAALRRSEEEYRALFTAMEQGFCIIEKIETAPGEPSDFQYLTVNPAFERHTGMHDVIGRTIRELVPDAAPRIMEIYDAVARTGEHCRFEDYVAALDLWMDAEVFPATGPGQIAVLFSNVSERKRAEMALRESEARLAAAFESVPVGIAVIGMDGAASISNESYRRFLPTGVIPSRDPAHVGRWQAWDAEGRPIQPQDFPTARALKGQRFVPGLDMLYSDGDGRDIWTSVATAPVRDASGQVTGVVSVIEDIDVRKRSQEALRESEERFRALVTAGTYSIYRMSPDWRIMYELDSQTLAITAEPNENWAEGYILPEDRPHVFAAIDEAIRTKSLFELEHRVRLADGSIGWVLSRAVPLFGRDGEIVEWFGAVSDVTERKRAVEALRESEERYRLIVENASDYAIFMTDLNDIITDWLPGAEKVFGWTAEEVIGRPAEIVFTPEDQAEGEPEKEIETAAREGSAPDVRWHQRKDGSQVFIEGMVTPLRAGNAHIVGYLKIGQDVTERRHAQELLEASERRMRTLATGIPQLVFRSLGDGYRTWGSPQWIAFTGLTFEESVGFGWVEGVPPDDREATLRAWEGVEERGEYYCEHRIYEAATGEYCWHQTRATPLRDEEGNILEWLGTSTDVEELRRLQRHQQLLMSELQHRVRNTLGVVRSIVRRTAEMSRDVPEMASHLQGRLAAFSRVQSAVTRAPNGGIGLAGLVEDELVAHAVREGERVRLSGPAVSLKARAAESLSLAIHELTSNAVKYGALGAEDGRLSIRWARQERGGRDWLRLEWIESGLDRPLEAPERRGFGLELLERSLPYELGAHTQADFAPEGFRFTMDMPLDQNLAARH